MKTFAQFIENMPFPHKWLENVDTPFVYHVTKKEYIPKIMKDGIKPMQTSNWVNAGGERQGQGEIYVFEDEGDAVRWAFKMDWDLYGGKMAGDIVILKIKNTGEWEPDKNSPLEQAGAFGRWLKRFRAIPIEDIVSVETLTPEMVKATSARMNKAYE